MSSEASAVLFTPEVDRRIIDGFLGDRAAMLEALAKEGLSEKAVRSRAAALGLTREFIAQCHLGGVDVLVRKCLVCDAPFVSLGAHNRLCLRCLKKQ